MSGLDDMHMKSGPEKPAPFNQLEAESFVAAGLRPARPEDMRARCIDGRYEPGAGAISMAGGDLGLLGVSYAAMQELSDRGFNVSRDLMKTATLKVIGGGDLKEGIRRFHYHTDEETVKQNGIPTEDLQGKRFFGCGHCKRLLTGDGYYLNETQKGYLLNDLNEIEQAGTRPIALKGGHADHRERAVFVVQRVHDLHFDRTNPGKQLDAEDNLLSFEEAGKYNHFVLDSQNHVLGSQVRSQAFVYNRGAVNQRLRELAKQILVESGDSTEKVKDVYAILKQVEEAHLGNTVSVLAEGLPVYYVFVDPNVGASVPRVVRR